MKTAPVGLPGPHSQPYPAVRGRRIRDGGAYGFLADRSLTPARASFARLVLNRSATMTAGAGRRCGDFADSSHVRKCAQTTRGHSMPAVSPLLIEGDENWFRRQPYSRVRKPHTAAVSAALTPHIVQEPCSRVDDPPRSHRRRVPTRTTLPTHLRSVDSSARSFTSFQPVRFHPWPLDSRSAEGWVMRGAW